MCAFPPQLFFLSLKKIMYFCDYLITTIIIQKMRRYIGFICLIVCTICLFSCKRDCICKGVHPASTAVEEHDFGKMTPSDCQDKQLFMNTDTTISSVYTWSCGN